MAFSACRAGSSSGSASPDSPDADSPASDPAKPGYQLRQLPVERRCGVALFRLLCSCFARGPPVWTHSGPAPIEEVKPGDRVLAQDVTTGELAYKPVLRVTGASLGANQDRLGDAESDGHARGRLSVVGGGWRMAKQLAAGTGCTRPTGAGRGEFTESAGLGGAGGNVAQSRGGRFRHVFRRAGGVLVHDIMPPEPATVALPGMRPGMAVTGR